MCACASWPDLDECTAEGTSQHSCQTICINIIGSYMCDCNAGYKLAPDFINCVGQWSISSSKHVRFVVSCYVVSCHLYAGEVAQTLVHATLTPHHPNTAIWLRQRSHARLRQHSHARLRQHSHAWLHTRCSQTRRSLDCQRPPVAPPVPIVTRSAPSSVPPRRPSLLFADVTCS